MNLLLFFAYPNSVPHLFTKKFAKDVEDFDVVHVISHFEIGSEEQGNIMASAMATKRLRKEYLALQRNPVEHITAVPLESNILEWHYVIQGTGGTAYAGGFYHGYLKFPPEYPMKPPSVLMCTPNGRFKTNQRLCLSMSDFHPETWNPMWSVSSILTGLYSFMVRAIEREIYGARREDLTLRLLPCSLQLESQPTLGSINTTDAQVGRLHCYVYIHG